MTSLPYTAAQSDPSAWNPIPGTAQDPAKKPKLNILEKFDRISDAVIASIPDDVLASVHLTREDLKLSLEERTDKIVMGFKQESAERNLPDAYEFDEPEYGPDDPLPKGYAWSSFCGDPRYKDFIVKMNCYVCGVAMDHWPDDCPKKRERVLMTAQTRNISDEIIPDSVIFPRISDDLLSSVHLTREDLKLSLEDRMKKIVRGFKEEMDDDDSTDEIDEPEYGPEDTLPKGYDWASFFYGTGDKDFIVHMDCFICGVGLDHWPVDCPKKKGTDD
ncbi:hypothetical protein ACLB2K_070944 [Fragaria x ananassa]